MKFEFCGKYIGTIRMRETHNGNPLKPGVKDILDGKTMEFSYCWACEDDEKYPGEYAMEPNIATPNSEDCELFRKAGITWIASGDVEWADDKPLIQGKYYMEFMPISKEKAENFIKNLKTLSESLFTLF